MSMRLGTVPSDLPFKTNPPVELISSLERLLLKPEPGMAANCSFFWTLVSLEAAIKAKLALSPAARPAGTVSLNWEFAAGHWAELPPPMVHRVPGVEDPVTTQFPAVYWAVMSWLTA